VDAVGGGVVPVPPLSPLPLSPLPPPPLQAQRIERNPNTIQLWLFTRVLLWIRA